MKEFLKKYLTEEQIQNLEESYKKDHPEQQGLPVYVGKKRLDEVLSKQKAAETEKENALKEVENLKASNQKAIDEAVKVAVEKAKQESATEMDNLKKEFATSEAVYKAHGKNLKAIKALMDPSKNVDEEIARIQESDPYLFNLPGDNDDLPGGTGKHKSKTSREKDAELRAMRKAVGLI